MSTSTSCVQIVSKADSFIVHLTGVSISVNICRVKTKTKTSPPTPGCTKHSITTVSIRTLQPRPHQYTTSPIHQQQVTCLYWSSLPVTCHWELIKHNINYVCCGGSGLGKISMNYESKIISRTALHSKRIFFQLSIKVLCKISQKVLAQSKVM